jgi:two-component system sensor histidine kinase KdpD
LNEHTVELDAPADLPAVLADASQVERVVANLVENAAKYSPAPGTIRLTACTHGDEVRLQVDDQGPGVPVEYGEEIFKKFYRLPGAQGAAPGTGLGLTISRRIVEAHGGRIWAENRPGGGARFTFTLPVAPTGWANGTVSRG